MQVLHRALTLQTIPQSIRQDVEVRTARAALRAEVREHHAHRDHLPTDLTYRQPAPNVRDVQLALAHRITVVIISQASNAPPVSTNERPVVTGVPAVAPRTFRSYQPGSSICAFWTFSVQR